MFRTTLRQLPKDTPSFSMGRTAKHELALPGRGRSSSPPARDKLESWRVTAPGVVFPWACEDLCKVGPDLYS